ncbi:MAG: hypothetical protein IID17_14470 [Nitrospinae bacterium]|nr:hypothetical protein [Nitrospinota bacterium]
MDFLGGLPSEIRSEGALKNFSGPDGGRKLAESFISLNKTFSSRSMADMDAPGDDAGRRAVLSKLGHAPPDSPDGYKLPDKANAPAFRALAHKHGLSAKQAEAMFTDMDADDARVTGERNTRMDSRKAETERMLRSEWGAEYDANLEHMKRGNEHFFGDDLRKSLEITGLDQHPEMRKVLYGLGRQLQEGTLRPGTGAAGGGATTIETAQKAVNDHFTEKNKLILSQNDMSPGVKEAKARHQELNLNLAKIKGQARLGASGQASGAGR